MNQQVKIKYLDDFTNDLQSLSKNKYNRISGKDAQLKSREMQKQTLAAITQTINRMSAVEEYNVEQIDGNPIRGPMKWIVLIFGQNHQAKDLRSLLQNEYRNLNIIAIMITNSSIQSRVQANMNSTSIQEPSQANIQQQEAQNDSKPNSSGLGSNMSKLTTNKDTTKSTDKSGMTGSQSKSHTKDKSKVATEKSMKVE